MEQVRFRYPGAAAPVLHDLSFTAEAGEGVAIFGRNGAGKTTLLRLAMGLLRGAEGTIMLSGRTAADALPEDLAHLAGFLFQHPETQLFERTVAAEVAFGPRCLGWDAARIDSAVSDALQEAGLEAVRNDHPWDLPGPHRRLVALAAVIASSPPLLLLDEPTAGVDRATRARVRDVVRRRLEAGVAVVAVTHDGEFALEALDRGLMLDGGRIAADAPVAGLLGAPGTPALPASAAIARGLGLDLARPRFDAVVAGLASHWPICA